MTKKDWDKLIVDIVDAFGGLDNIKEVYHCATRFRVYAFDDSKVSKAKIEKLALQKGYTQLSNKQWQIIFGSGTVNQVFDKYQQYVNDVNPEKNSSVKKVNAKEAKHMHKEPVWDKQRPFWSNVGKSLLWLVRQFADIFIPLIPIFIAGGISLALNSFVGAVGATDDAGALIGGAAEASKFFDTIGGAIFSFLPIFIGWTAMKKFGGTPVIGMAIGMILVAPGLANSWSVQAPIEIGLSLSQNSMGSEAAYIDFAIVNGYVIVDTSGAITGISNSIQGADAINDALSNANVATDINYALSAIALDRGIFTVAELESAIANPTLGGFASYTDFLMSNTASYIVLFSNGTESGGFFSVNLIGYQAQVFSTLMAVGFGYYVQKFITFFSPSAIAIVSIPLLTVLISTYFGLWVWGPFGQIISEGLASLFNTIYYSLNFVGFGLGGFIVAFLYPLTVLVGLNQGFLPVETTLISQTAVTYGESFTWITPIASVANVALGAAALTIAFIVVSNAKKSNAISGGVTANLGITEPAIYGTNIRLLYPFFAAMIGSAIGGYWMGMTNTVATTLGSASWIGLVQFNPVASPEYLQYLSDNGQTPFVVNQIGNLASAAIGMTIAFVSTVGFTFGFAYTKWGKKNNELAGYHIYPMHMLLNFKKRRAFAHEVRDEVAATDPEAAEEYGKDKNKTTKKDEIIEIYNNTINWVKVASVNTASESKRGAIETWEAMKKIPDLFKKEDKNSSDKEIDDNDSKLEKVEDKKVEDKKVEDKKVVNKKKEVKNKK